MEYLEALLQIQMQLAAALEAEPEDAGERRRLTKRRQERRYAEGEQAQEMRSGAENREFFAEKQERNGNPDGAEQLLKEWVQRDAARTRMERLTMMARSEQSLRMAQTEQGMAPSQSENSRFQGGILGHFAAEMGLEGPAGVPTQRSMSEISRFFERDARRYGG